MPDTPAGAAALARTDARVVARYRSFSLVEAAGDDYRRLRAAGAERRDDMRKVTTAAGALDPAADRASLAGKRAPDRDEVLALVQFVGPPKDAWVERLRATGARIVTYQAENAYLVHASGAAVERLAALVGTRPAVRAVTPVTARTRSRERPRRRPLRGLDGRRPARARRRATRRRRRRRRRRPRDRRHAAHPVPRAIRGRGGRAGTRPGIVAIERDVPPTPTDERAAQIVAGNLAPPLHAADRRRTTWPGTTRASRAPRPSRSRST